MGVTHAEDLTSRLRELSKTGGTARLADLAAPRRWDTVHVFFEGASASRIEEIVGEPVLRGNRYLDPGNLLVFVDGGVVTEVVSVLPDILSTGGRVTWGPDTRLEPVGTSRPAIMRLVAEQDRPTQR